MGRRAVVQNHHISYKPEVTVTIYKGEHWICTQLQRRRKVSKGFIKALETWIEENRAEAVELGT
jgi:hypothetical protein